MKRVTPSCNPPSREDKRWSYKELVNYHEDLCFAAKKILEAKNHDYGGSDGDRFANFRGTMALGIDPVIGVLLRMQDKIMRVKTFAEKGHLEIKNESVEDALVDIINYAVLIGGMIKEAKE